MTSSAARYLTVGRFRLRVPRRRGVLPPAGPILLPAALTLLSMDVPRLRRWRRRLLARLGRLRSRGRGGRRRRP